MYVSTYVTFVFGYMKCTYIHIYKFNLMHFYASMNQHKSSDKHTELLMRLYVCTHECMYACAFSIMVEQLECTLHALPVIPDNEEQQQQQLLEINAQTHRLVVLYFHPYVHTELNMHTCKLSIVIYNFREMLGPSEKGCPTVISIYISTIAFLTGQRV